MTFYLFSLSPHWPLATDYCLLITGRLRRAFGNTEKGGIGRDRTGGLVLRRHSLYPTELRPLFFPNHNKPSTAKLPIAMDYLGFFGGGNLD